MLLGLTIVGFFYGLYNLKQSQIIPEIEYKLDGFGLSNLPYQGINTIYKNSLNDKNKCKQVGNNKEKIVKCFQNLESNIYYIRQNMSNVKYDNESEVLRFDCDFEDNSKIKNATEIKVDNYGKKGYKKLNTKAIKVITGEEAEQFKKRLLSHGQCSYILSGIKDSYLDKGKTNTQVIVPVKLDIYMWFKDDLSIFYHQEKFNYNIE